MGWLENDAGLWGDAPADAMADGVDAALAVVTSTGTGLAGLLCGLLDALRCDGVHAPFTAERQRVASLHVSLRELRIDAEPGKSDPGCAAALFDALDAVALAYRDAELDPPSLRQVLRYFASSAARDAKDLYDALDRVEVRFGGRKPRDRAQRPTIPSVTSSRRVRHRTFGIGALVETRGDKVIVDFPTGRRMLLARVVEPE
jgi:hypothetical protein